MEKMEDEQDLLTIALAIDDLKHDDILVRLKSYKQLDLIASALGGTRSRTELLPFINMFAEDEDEEVLVVMAEKLADMLDLVGGPHFAESLLIILETLCGIEELAVHEATVASIIKLRAGIPKEMVCGLFMHMLERLSISDNFACRRSAAALIPDIFPFLTTSKDQSIALGHFSTLCRDGMSMVRRVACSCLGKMALVLNPDQLVESILPVFLALTNEAQDSTRLLMVSNCIDLASVLPCESTTAKVLPVALSLCADPCWRVRYMAADLFPKLIDSLGENSKEQLTPSFVNLLTDPEEEVRTSACRNLYRVCSKLLHHDDILASLSQLGIDSSPFTRIALASSILQVSSTISSEQVESHILPVFLILLSDINPEVRLTIISEVGSLHQATDTGILDAHLIPAIVKLAKDPKWRIRLSVVDRLAMLASKLGKPYFESSLMPICLNAINDAVYAVRESAIVAICSIAVIFGESWTITFLVPHFERLCEECVNISYLHRMTVLYLVHQLCKRLNSMEIVECLVPLILSLETDPVPNVRLVVCKTLQSIYTELVDHSPSKSVMLCLHRLSDDADPDVHFFATQAIATMSR